jgi:DNA-binding CsgD family transcriptional regulator
MAASENRRWLRDMGSLLALPALWVDHEPQEIATSLLSVLVGVLQLEGVYARFVEYDEGRPLEMWRPSGQNLPAELAFALDTEEVPASVSMTRVVVAPARNDTGPLRVTCVPLALPWGTGLVLGSAGRTDFPTAMETQLLRVAVSQGAIAIHTARRLAHEHAARAAAENRVFKQNELLRSLVESRATASGSASAATAVHGEPADASARAALPPLTRREVEVLGLLARGLSNKEIAGVMWLSDRTVERHITGLYRKIGVVRRSEATAFALRHGVV